MFAFVFMYKDKLCFSSFITLQYIGFVPYFHNQTSGCQILQYLSAVIALSEHWCVIVHVRHIDDNRCDVTEGRLSTTSLHGQVVLPGHLEVQRGHEGEKACKMMT